MIHNQLLFSLFILYLDPQDLGGGEAGEGEEVAFCDKAGYSHSI